MEYKRQRKTRVCYVHMKEIYKVHVGEQCIAGTRIYAAKRCVAEVGHKIVTSDIGLVDLSAEGIAGRRSAGWEIVGGLGACGWTNDGRDVEFM